MVHQENPVGIELFYRVATSKVEQIFLSEETAR